MSDSPVTGTYGINHSLMRMLIIGASEASPFLVFYFKVKLKIKQKRQLPDKFQAQFQASSEACSAPSFLRQVKEQEKAHCYPLQVYSVCKLTYHSETVKCDTTTSA